MVGSSICSPFSVAFILKYAWQQEKEPGTKLYSEAQVVPIVPELSFHKQDCHIIYICPGGSCYYKPIYCF